MSRKNKIVKWADVCDWNYFWSTWDKTASTGFSSECFVFRINTSIQLRSSLITINSLPFRCEKTKRNLLHFPALHSNFFWAYKLVKSLHYIRFIWCVVCTNDRGLPQTMLESWKRSEKKEERKLFSPCHLHTPRIHFPDQPNTRGAAKKAAQIKDVLSEFIPPCTVSRRSLFLKVMS